MSKKYNHDVINKIRSAKSRVTIITPTFNRADLIKSTIESIFSQSYEDYTYIVIDDGSTDNTGQVVKELFKDKGNCFYVYHDNIGEAETVNVGWNLCTSEYFVQVNSDDTVEPNLLAEMVDALDKRPDCIVAYPDFYIVNEEGVVVEEVKNMDWNFVDAFSVFSCYAAAPGAFFRKSALSDIKTFKDSRFKHTNDIKMLWNLALKGDFIHVPKRLACWRTHDNGISSSRYEAIDEINIWIEEYFNQDLPKKIKLIEPVCRQSIFNYFSKLMKESGQSYAEDMANYYSEKAKLPMPKYKNLQISDNDLVGNKFNGHDLHINLRALGVDSTQLVWNKESTDSNTYVIAGEKHDRVAIRNYSEYIQRLYGLDNVHNPLIYDILYNKLFLDADIVHLHLMHNGLWDLNLLPLMSALKPIVWTVHDMWIATGDPRAELHPDYFFPLPSSAKNLELNWEIKKNAIDNSNITFVVASNYMKKAMSDFPTFAEKKIVYIPFGLNFDIFYPRDVAKTRSELGLGVDEKIILVRGNVREKKGLDYIEYVLNKFESKYRIHLLIVGPNELNIPSSIKFTHFGWVNDDELMAKIYSSADLFLMPSTREYFGMMAIESMACGTLPIVLDGTALPDTVNAPSCGVSTPQNMEKYAASVEYYLNNIKERVSREKRGLRHVRVKHDMGKYLKSLNDLYLEVIHNHAKDYKHSHVLEKMKLLDEVKPRLIPVDENMKNSSLEKDAQQYSFFEATVAPLRNEITRLRLENSTIDSEKKILERTISDILSSKRWKYATKIAETKGRFLNK